MQPSHQLDHRLSDTFDLIEQRAANLFVTRQYWCAESVFFTLNRALDGGLDNALALRLASGLGEGIGGSGCVCGGLNGGALAIGLFLGNSNAGWHTNRQVMDHVRHLHDRFKDRFGATCCRVLTKPVTRGTAPHFQLCARHTGAAARMAAEIILAGDPGKTVDIDVSFLRQQDSRLGAGIRMAAERIGGL